MVSQLSKTCSFSLLSLALILLMRQPIVTSMKVASIPSNGSPPMNIIYSCSVFDPQTSSIFIIGGQNQYTSQDTSDVYSYNLLTNTWSQVVRNTEFSAYGLKLHYCYLTKQRVVYVLFGSSNQLCFTEVLTFDLNSLIWSIATLTGDFMEGRTNFLASSFIWNNTETIAIYGGYTNSGYDDNIYL
jgi:hypothetical protein